MGIFAEIVDFLRSYGALLGIIITWLGLAWVNYRRRVDWARRNFLDQVVFSLNYVENGNLVMRTLRESAAREIWLNEQAVRLIMQAAEETTVDQPFVVLDDAKDQYIVHQGVMNAISEQFADGFIARTMGLPVTTKTYLFAITFEREVDIRSLKLRVLMVSVDDIKTIFNPDAEASKTVGLVSDHYRIRMKTLQQMYQVYAEINRPKGLRLGRVVLSLRN